MAYYSDLTTYRYDSDEQGVLNIGWLDSSIPFPRGETPAEFCAALDVLCRHPMRLHRGFHLCPFCGENRGNGQIRVLGDQNRWYAAPTMVHHYVVTHSYRPPDEFVAAIICPQAIAVDFR